MSDMSAKHSPRWGRRSKSEIDGTNFIGFVCTLCGAEIRVARSAVTETRRAIRIALEMPCACERPKASRHN